MFLFIFESIGTSELILVGIVALIFLGPRKLPEMAKKAGKLMSEFRGTANEFKQTWEREVNFEEEVKSLSLSNLNDDTKPAKDLRDAAAATTVQPNAPTIKAADPEQFKHLIPPADNTENVAETNGTVEKSQIEDKINWL